MPVPKCPKCHEVLRSGYDGDLRIWICLGCGHQADIAIALGHGVTRESVVPVGPIRASKYMAVRTTVDGITFDSKREAARYSELLLMQKAGEILGLETKTQVCVFNIVVSGVKICKYICDFTYIVDSKRIFEDVKSKPTQTPVYRLKKKLVKAMYGIDILETA